ncbi:MAG: hydrogenase maturation nickel metallochaperone HypA [Capsulimonas sp.]|jgi:hydrogenase nickel incorporation protein HypA/HybF|uniref:hydrogenase maturation nickel metallochaperone HypA/HybF n=1 Tax=Capsulimonas sp. TaxID=2494211 RepID=UPI003265E91F
MPHEVDMTKALMMSLKDWYSQQTERWPVRRVQLLVGEFTCVEPDLLRTAFAKQKLGTFLENAEIAIRDSPFIAFCRNCEREYKPDINLEYGCPECRAPLDEIRSGRELKIEKVDWDIPVGAER